MGELCMNIVQGIYDVRQNSDITTMEPHINPQRDNLSLAAKYVYTYVLTRRVYEGETLGRRRDAEGYMHVRIEKGDGTANIQKEQKKKQCGVSCGFNMIF